MDPDHVKKVKGGGLLPYVPTKYQKIKKTELYRFGAQPSYLANNMKEALFRHEEQLKQDAEDQEIMMKNFHDGIKYEEMQNEA